MKTSKHFSFLLITIVTLLTACSQKAEYDLAITDVILFNSKDKSTQSHQTILVKADTIAAIIDAKTPFTSENIIEGKGRLLIPGMIDTHVHLVGNYGVDAETPSEFMDGNGLDMLRELTAHSYLKHGITTIIDMGQPETWMDITLDWQKNPSPAYPDLFICGGSIVSDEDRQQPAHHIEVMNPEDGRAKVREYAKKGLKYMKLYRKLRKPDYEAMADEAKKQGIIINSHVDNNVVTIGEAMDYGVRNFEHFFTVTPSILSYDHWPLMEAKYNIKMNASIDEFAAHMVFFFSYIKEQPEFDAKLNKLFDSMAAEGASISTALNVLASAAGKTDFFSSFEYFPIRTTPMVSYSDEQQKQLDFAYQSMMEYIKKAHDKGVQLRIGTDCRFGGSAMMSELILLAKAGIPVEEVLKIATLNGYESMKLDKERGSIEIGKKADMVLFDKNPFKNLENFNSTKTIIKDGKLFSLKRSIAHEIKDVFTQMTNEEALTWFKKAKTSPEYAPLDKIELQNAVKELIGGSKIKEGMTVYKIYKEEFPKDPMHLNGILLTNTTYALIREKQYKEAIDFYRFSESNFPKSDKFLALSILISILENDIAAGQRQFDQFKDKETYLLDENEMNGVGYLLLQLDKVEEAIAVFQMNVSAFPNSWNVYDSMGEAYLLVGKRPEAIENYKKSLDLNPKNSYGIAALKKLGVQ